MGLGNREKASVGRDGNKVGPRAGRREVTV